MLTATVVPDTFGVDMTGRAAGTKAPAGTPAMEYDIYICVYVYMYIYIIYIHMYILYDLKSNNILC